MLALKCYFASIESDDDRSVNDARGYACEYVAWRFVTHVSEREAIDFLLTELSSTPEDADNSDSHREADLSVENGRAQTGGERTPLLSSNRVSRSSSYFGTDTIAPMSNKQPFSDDDFDREFANLNAVEIAVVAEAKKFLSQKPVQKIINGIWRGDIVFWETLSVHSVKKAKIYNKRRADPYSRLRVPRYLKVFEVIFFGLFLAFYYGVLTHRSVWRVTVDEIFLYIWIAGFAYNEVGELLDAGRRSSFHWTCCDIG